MRNPNWTKEELEIFYDSVYDKLCLSQKRGNMLMTKLKEIEANCDFSNDNEKKISTTINDTIKQWRALANER
jgi:hypothetical protein